MSASDSKSGSPVSDGAGDGDDDDGDNYDAMLVDSNSPTPGASVIGTVLVDPVFKDAQRDEKFLKLASDFYDVWLPPLVQGASGRVSFSKDDVAFVAPEATMTEKMAKVWRALQENPTLERAIGLLNFHISVLLHLMNTEDGNAVAVLEKRDALISRVKAEVENQLGTAEGKEVAWAEQIDTYRTDENPESEGNELGDEMGALVDLVDPDDLDDLDPAVVATAPSNRDNELILYANRLASKFVSMVERLLELASGDGYDMPSVPKAEAVMAKAMDISEGNVQILVAWLEIRLFVLVLEMRGFGAQMGMPKKSEENTKIARSVLEKIERGQIDAACMERAQREGSPNGDGTITQDQWKAARRQMRDDLEDDDFVQWELQPYFGTPDSAPGEGMGDELPEEDEIDAYEDGDAEQRARQCNTYNPMGMEGAPEDPIVQQTNAFNAHIAPFLRDHSEHAKHLPALQDNSWYEDSNDVLKANGYTLAFLTPTADAPDAQNLWIAFVEKEMDFATMRQGACTYFAPSCQWSKDILEELRVDTIKWWYKDYLQTALAPSTIDAEIETYEGPANRVFVWRLVVVHLRALEHTGTCTEMLPVTSCFAMDTLVDNVAHMLKYRRCIRMAKCIYKNVVFEDDTNNSLHAQYRAKLLNVQHAHHHQDEGSEEIGIARRIIRQAHVANYRHFYYRGDTNKTPKTPMDPDWNVAYKDAEHYFTNPPLAPIMCAAPPRMGKSALTLLMVSFASKLGANVEYGVAPNKTIPLKDVEAKIQTLQWETAMKMPHVQIYSQELQEDVKQMCRRIHRKANGLDNWIFHVRDEAQSLIKNKHALKVAVGMVDLIEEDLQNSYPVFYGLTMCVSATLLPVFGVGQVTGSVDSVYELLKNHKAGSDDLRRFRNRRGALMKNIVLQPWSFPIAPDFLTPPRTHFPMGDEAATNAADWYKKYYGRLTDGKSERARTTNYYGMSFHVRDWTIRRQTPEGQEGEEKIPHILSNKVLLDRTLHDAMLKIMRLSYELRRYKQNYNQLYNLDTAYADYLKTFNRLNTRYFDVVRGQWMQSNSTRVVNRPIVSLTRDASYMLEHAQEWLNEPPSEPAATAYDLRPNCIFYPMLIMAPVREKGGTNGRLEWVVLLCKLAWLRFQRAYTENPEELKSMRKEKLKREYGIAVLAYSFSRKGDYVGLVCAESDYVPGAPSDRIATVVFDPTLPENRFPDQVLHDPDGTEGSSEGTMLRNTLVPFLSEKDYDDYVGILDAARRANKPAEMDAKQFVASRVVLKVYNYEANPTDAYGYYALDEVDYGDEYADDYGDDAAVPNWAGESSSDEDARDDSDEEDVRRNRLEKAKRIKEKARMVAKSVIRWQEVREDDVSSEADDDMDDDTNVAGDRSAPVDPDAAPADDDAEDGLVDPMDLTDMNAIALRLCVREFADSQRAVKHIKENCGIVKVAAVGYSMLKAGLTLQSTLKTDGRLEFFVPKYMSFALNSQKKGPDLSYLYQLVGRGFVDMKRHALPPNWKLQLLSKKGSLELIREYGNAELITSTVHHESLAGRLMTVGGTLWSANKDMVDTKVGYATKRLKGDDADLTISSVLFQGRGAKNQSLPSTRPKNQLVFGTLRKCVAGEHKPARWGDLTGYEKHRERYDQAFVHFDDDDAPVILKRYEKSTNSELLVGRTNHARYNEAQGFPPPPSCAPEIRPKGEEQMTSGGYYKIPRRAWCAFFKVSDVGNELLDKQNTVKREKLAAWARQKPRFIADALDGLIDSLNVQLSNMNKQLAAEPPIDAREKAIFDNKMSQLKRKQKALADHINQCAYTMGYHELTAMIDRYSLRVEASKGERADRDRKRLDFYKRAAESLQSEGREHLQGGENNMKLYDLYASREARRRLARTKMSADDMATLICSRWGVASNMFTGWYTKITEAEEAEQMPGGGMRLVQLGILAIEPEGASSEELETWVHDVLKTHHETIARNHVWIRPHLQRMREYVLDLIFGKDSTNDSDWRENRGELMPNSGYTKEDTKRRPDIMTTLSLDTRDAQQYAADMIARESGAVMGARGSYFRTKQEQMLDLLQQLVSNAQDTDQATREAYLREIDKFASAWSVIYDSRRSRSSGLGSNIEEYLGPEYVGATKQRRKDMEAWAATSYDTSKTPPMNRLAALVSAIKLMQSGDVENHGSYRLMMQGLKLLLGDDIIEAAEKLFEERYGGQL